MRHEGFGGSEAMVPDGEWLRLWRLFEKIGIGLVWIAADGRIGAANPFAQKLLGLSSDGIVGQRAGETPVAAFSVDGAPIPAQSLPCLEALGSGREIRGRVMGLSGVGRGELVWVNLEVIPVLHPDSCAVLGAWAVLEDITERKRVEDSLRRSIAENRTLVENVPGAVFRCELAPPWRVSFLSAGALSVTGYPPEDFTSGKRAWADIMAPEEVERVAGIVQQAREERRPYEVEYRIRHADGSERWVQERGQAVFSAEGEPLWLDGVVIDVTARKQADRALRESEAWLRESQRISRIGSYSLDVKTGLWKGSEALDEIFGIGPDYKRDVAGWSELVHPDHREQMLEYFQKEVLEKRKPFDREYMIVRRSDGQRRWVLGRGSLTLNEAGEPVAMTGTIQDVTERRVMEEQLAAAQRMEAVGRLAGGIAHDFNNILTVINGYADFTLRLLPPDSPFRASLAEIRNAGERAASLTRQLLAFSRRQMVTPERLNLNALIREAVSLLARLLGEKVRLETDLAEDLGWVQADPSQMHQILLNFSANARDAMPEGGVLTIQTANAEISEAEAALHPEARPGSFIRLSVADTGTGMDAETLEHLFEPFFTTKPHGQGTGLGLATVYGIVKQSGGWIEVQSAPGAGSTFAVFLPRAEAPVAETGGAGETAVRLAARVVLVVDDQPDVRHFAATVLRSAGYEVLEAASGEQALALCGGYGGRIDAVLTDIVMPGMSGRDLALLLAANHPEIKVVYMSGHAGDPQVRQSLMASGDLFLLKPFGPADLVAKLRQATGGFRRGA
mgnify:CR=1 FL=1